jgi:hypothetical protein
MYLQKHTLQITASSLAIAAIFVFLGGVRMPVLALDIPSDSGAAYAMENSNRAFPSPSYSSVQISVSTRPDSLFNFSQETQTLFSILKFSRAPHNVNDGTTVGGRTYGGVVGGELLAMRSAEPATKVDWEACVGDKLLQQTCIPLIQPLGSRKTLVVQPGALTFIDYFNQASSLLITISVGFAVLWILIGSYFIMMSGSNGGMRGTGKSMIMWALIGLIIVNFAGFFLRTMNSIFFT